MIDFTDQSVIVTGAGRGLGRLYAREFATRGAAVVVNDIDRAEADAVVAEITGAGGRAVAAYESVAARAGAQAIVDCAVAAFGRLDALVSNAGIFRTAPFDELTGDEWQQMLDVHLTGAFNVSQAAYRVMKRDGGGRIVFIASSAGMFGQPNSAHYAVAKAGTVGLANVVAIEGAEHGIKANCVLPFGYTRMVFDTVGMTREELEPEPGFLHAIEPELVVPMVVYLASRACELTHQNFSAGAGRFARVFVGLADGWLGQQPTVDDIAAQLAAITATEPYSVPDSIFDEVTQICAQLGI